MPGKIPMKFRKLRIALLVGCVLACLLLIVLWVRSYWREDGVCLGVTEKRGFFFFSSQGRLVVQYISFAGSEDANISRWFVDSYSAGGEDFFWFPREEVDAATYGFRLWTTGGFFLVVPHWFLLTILAGAGALLQFRQSWRFSLRTLLVMMTLVALAFGLIVALIR
jgi:hypothetical protein